MLFELARRGVALSLARTGLDPLALPGAGGACSRLRNQPERLAFFTLQLALPLAQAPPAREQRHVTT